MNRLSVVGFALAVTLRLAGPARAHIDVTSPRERSLNAGNQKIGPCGGNSRGMPTTRNPDIVNLFKPGQKIVVEIEETIDHLGYYRVAFDDDGQDVFKFPAAPGTPGHVIPAGKDGVLVPEVKDAAGQSRYTIEVTLPDIECTSCTLQIVQIMTDRYMAGVPWNEEDGSSIYYRCADVILSKGAPDDVTGQAGTAARGCSYGGVAESKPWGVLIAVVLWIIASGRPRRWASCRPGWSR